VDKYDRNREGTDESRLRRIRFACWIARATKTHSEYVINIPWPQQRWLNDAPE